jgi:hypothetical protein
MESAASLASEDASIRFLLRLGRAMHAYGYSAEQLERALIAMAGRLGLEGQFFTTPTSILAAIGPLPRQRTFLIRTEPGTIDLGKLDELESLQNDVLESRLTPEAGLARVEALFASTAPSRALSPPAWRLRRRPCFSEGQRGTPPCRESLVRSWGRPGSLSTRELRPRGSSSPRWRVCRG